MIAIAQNSDLLHRLDATFFMVGEAQKGKLVKFYGGEEISGDDLRADLDSWGLEVERLEEQGTLQFINDEDPARRQDQLARLLKDDSIQESTLWASFDWSHQMSLEKALEQQEALSNITDRQLVVKTAALEEAIDSWPPAILRRAQVLHLRPDLAFRSGDIPQSLGATAGLIS